MIKDLGSGLNFKKKGLNKLLTMILNREISHIIINHKERLLRFGHELLFKICTKLYGSRSHKNKSCI